MHSIWTMPEQDTDYSSRWRHIKASFSRALPVGEHRSDSRTSKRERGIWQRRFWEHTIRDERDYAVHMDYVHFNPVRHGLVRNVAEWPYSSFHRHVAQGTYPASWASTDHALATAGERDDDTRWAEAHPTKPT